jgi:hypothetical protein
MEIDKIFSLFLSASHFLTVDVNWAQFLLNDSLDAALQKYIVNACSPLNTAKIIKIYINGVVTYETSFMIKTWTNQVVLPSC